LDIHQQQTIDTNKKHYILSYHTHYTLWHSVITAQLREIVVMRMRLLMMVVLACAHACLERTIHSVESRILVAQRRPGAWSKVAFLSYAREKVARRVRKWQLFSRSRARALTVMPPCTNVARQQWHPRSPRLPWMDGMIIVFVGMSVGC
jgi:hypothetical protein